MIDVQDLIAGTSRPGINADVVEFDQDVLAQLKALKLALLIFDAFDLRVLHQLHVESNELIREAFQRIDAPEAARPGRDILNPATDRRREPSFGTPSVVETRLAVTSFSMTPPSTERATRVQRSFDARPAMLDLGGENNFAGLLIDNCNACYLRSGIDALFREKISRVEFYQKHCQLLVS